MTFVSRFAPGFAGVLPAAPAGAWQAVAGRETLHLHASSRTTATCVIALPGAGRVVRKRWNWPRRRDRIKGALRTTFAARSPARREFEALERLRALAGGPFAPEPLGYLEHRSRGVLRECLLLVTEVGGAADLGKWLTGAPPGPARAALLELLARRTRAMHDAGLVDFEMHPRNVLVAPGAAGVLKVDCAKQRRRRGPASRSDRARDLAALDVGLVRLATPPERAAFFAAYGTDAALTAAVERERLRIDERESRRLEEGTG